MKREEQIWLIYKPSKGPRKTKPFQNKEIAERWAIKNGLEIICIGEHYKKNEVTRAERCLELAQQISCSYDVDVYIHEALKQLEKIGDN